jgi:hypothetical protein
MRIKTIFMKYTNLCKILMNGSLRFHSKLKMMREMALTWSFSSLMIMTSLTEFRIYKTDQEAS